LEYNLRPFTPRQKKNVIDFLTELSVKTRKLLSVSGIDPESIYMSFREDWERTWPICLYRGEKLVGIGKLSPHGQDGVYLSCLVIADKEHHKGLGSRIIEYLIAIGMLNGATSVTLEARKENKKAQLCFNRNGFKYTSEQEETFTMVRRL